MDRGDQAYKVRDFETAIDCFTVALELLPSESEKAALCLRLANAYDGFDRYEDSLRMLKQCLEINPDWSVAWNNLGVLCQKLGKSNEAMEAFERAYRCDPSNADILVSLGSVSLKQGDPGHAKEFLDLALDINPQHPIAHANMAITLCVFGRIEEAEESLALAALYGFTKTDPIQDRIAKMKLVREQVFETLKTADAGGDSQMNGQQSESGELLQLLHLQEQRFRREWEECSEESPEKALLSEQLALVRQQIATLRGRTTGGPADVEQGQQDGAAS